MTTDLGNQILIVEDEKNLGLTLSEYLSNKGHSCKLARSVQEVREYLRSGDLFPHVVLMDIGLPDGSGIELAREMRGQRKDFVLLFLSAQNDPTTRLQGLELGGDDYITKPFELRELILRLERILRTKKELDASAESIVHGPLKIWFKKYEVEDAQGNILPLSQKECAILKLLYENRNRAVDREQMISEIWGENSYPSNRTVDNYIVKLRKWSDTDPDGHLKFQSIRGVGYKIVTKE